MTAIALHFPVHGGGLGLAGILLYRQHLHREAPLPEADGDDVPRSLSQASLATVRLLMMRDTFRYLSSLMVIPPLFEIKVGKQELRRPALPDDFYSIVDALENR